MQFTEYPKRNVAVSEGGEYQFSCAALLDQARASLLWFLENGGEYALGGNRTFPDGMVATVGSDHRSPLTLSNITTFWNGAVIRCVVNNGEIVNQPQPFPMLIVNASGTYVGTLIGLKYPLITSLHIEK